MEKELDLHHFKKTDKTMEQKTYEDLIFERKNKSYGAYELRTNYDNRLMGAFALGIGGLLFIAINLYLLNHSNKIVPMKPSMTDRVVFSQLFEAQKFTVEQVKKTAGHIAKAATLTTVVDPNAYKPVAVVDPLSQIVKPTTPDPTISTELTATSTTIASTEGGSGVEAFGIPPVGIVVSNAVVDQQPEFPGGLENFYKFLSVNIHFPAEALREGISAKLFVSFVIDTDGRLISIEFVKKAGYGMEAAIEKVLDKSPLWLPGRVKSAKVNTKMILPVAFNLIQ